LNEVVCYPDPSNFNKIIWLASYPKSGNTWMRILLGYYLFGRAKNWNLDLNTLGRLMPGDASPAFFQQVSDKPLEMLTEEEIHALRPAYQKRLTQYPRTMFVKTHSGFFTEIGQPHIVPEYTEGAILIVRDPRDVACSVMRHFGFTADEAVDMMTDSQYCLGGALPGMPKTAETVPWTRLGTWGRHAQSWAGLGKACLLVKYEDLKNSPINFLQAYARWAGQKYDRKAALKAVRLSSIDTLRKREATEGFKERSHKADKFFGPAKVGRWREVLMPAQVSRLWAVNGDVAEDLGYRPEV